MILFSVHLGGRVIERKEFRRVDRLSIGRAATNDIVLDNTGVSRVHCEIVREGRVQTLCDRGSNNGTFVNGKRVTVHFLNSGDSIAIGKFSLSFEEDPLPAPPPAASKPGSPALAVGAGEIADTVDDEAVAASDDAAKSAATEQFEATISVDPRYMEARVREHERRVKGYLVDLDRKAEPIILDKPIFTAGKAPRSDLKLTGLFARARHSIIVRDEAGFHLCDASGRSRTYVNGTPCDIELLHDGDELLLGHRRVRFMVGSPLSSKPGREGTTRMRKPGK